MPSRRPPWAWLAGIVVTVGLLWWVLHDVEWAVAIDHVRRADILLLTATVIVATSTFLLRAFRWRVMLRDQAGARLPLRPLWHAVAIGFMANNLLPARAGEFARAWVLGREAPVRVSTALASIVVERMFDAVAILGLMTLALLAPSFPTGAQIGGVGVHRVAFTVGAIFGGALLLSVVVVLRPEPWIALVRAASGRLLPARFAEKLVSVAQGLVDGLAVLRTPARVAGVLAWSFFLWSVNAAALWLAVRAFHIDVPPEAILLFQGLLAIGVAIPAAPGFFGVFEAVTIVALGFYGVPKDHAVSYAVAYHITTFIPITVLGLQALARLGVRFRDLRESPAS